MRRVVFALASVATAAGLFFAGSASSTFTTVR